MRIFLFICAILGIFEGFAESGTAKTVFQQIAGGQMILGGFVCLAAASVLELLSDSILQSRLIAAQQNFAIQSLEQATDSIAKLAIALQTANEIAITGVQKNEAFAAKADVARDRTNQLLVW